MDTTVLSKRKSEPLNLVLPPELKAAVVAYANEHNMSAGAAARLALLKFFQRELAKKASSDASGEVSHE